LAEYDSNFAAAVAADAAVIFADVSAVDGQSSITICDSIGLLLGSGAIDFMGSERHGLRAARRRSTAESIFRVFLLQRNSLR